MYLRVRRILRNRGSVLEQGRCAQFRGITLISCTMQLWERVVEGVEFQRRTEGDVLYL